MKMTSAIKKSIRPLGSEILSGVVAVATLLSVSCAPNNTGKSEPKDGVKIVSEGTSSGGGSFGDESSMRLLNKTKKIVAAALRDANPNIYKGFPKGWTPERLAKIVETIHAEPRTEVSRYNRELMFDYRVPKTGEPYLVATALFFRAHAAIPVNSLWEEDLEPHLRELRTKLLHEAAHLMGIGLTEQTDYKARGFARFMIVSLMARNNVVCRTKEVPVTYPGFVADEELAKAKEAKNLHSEYYYWILNRALGFALQTQRYGLKVYASWLEDLIRGKSTIYPNFLNLPLLVANPQLSKVEYRRYFEVPEGQVDMRLLQQHFVSATSTNPDLISFIGRSENYLTAWNEPGRCAYQETLTIPKSSKGDYKARLVYENKCDVPSEDHRDIIFAGAIDLDCVESWDELDIFDQFLGDTKFTDPRMQEWMRTRE